MEDIPFILDVNANEPPTQVKELIQLFENEVVTCEKENGIPFLLFQDGKSQSFYLECHIKAEDAIPLIDQDAVLDPDDQEEYRLQRDLRPSDSAYIQMILDAQTNRQFSDIIAEYDPTYNEDYPLKLLGGQHRTKAIETAINNRINRYHGFKIYFGLSIPQRAEIAQISNTNIAISADLIDRMQETLRGPELRNFSQNIGLLNLGEDFADRRSVDGRITVRQARTFIVNYYEGIENQSKNLGQDLFVPYLCKVGQEDPKYIKIILERPNLWDDPSLLEAGRQFAKLHTKQISIISSNTDLNTGTLRNKAVSFAVLSSWAFVAGLLQNNPDRLRKLYSLPESSGRSDPLNADTMTASRSVRDLAIYRGLAVRDSELDRGRVTELFLEYSDKGGKITKKLCETAIAMHDYKVAGRQLSKLKGN